MKRLKKLANKPIIGWVAKAILRFGANREAKQIANHFAQFLEPQLAVGDSMRENAYRIRHNVYCEELNFEPVKDNKQEIDDFDRHSYHCLIQHKSTKNFAGTVRVVYSRNEGEQLPLEKYCLDSIDHKTLTPANFARHEICEISRLAVPAEFRRRQADKFAGAATGAINENVYSETELRCFPFIAVGLYLSAASILIDRGINHCFVMMEPRLARSLAFVGIPFEQIGPVVEYHGKRAPYYIDPRTLQKTLSPGFKRLYRNIGRQLEQRDDVGDELTPSPVASMLLN